jgi:two-component system, cell cycle sensor histidine kinase DivJ
MSGSVQGLGSDHVLGSFMDRLVHADARRDRRTRDVHARFIGIRILVACLGCAALPVCLILHIGLSSLALTAFAAVVLLLLPAMLVARTGRIEQGYALSSVLLSGAICALALQSGGLASPVLALFALVVLDTALSGSRNVFYTACIACLCATGLIGIISAVVPADVGDVSMSSQNVATVMVAYALVMSAMLVSRGERNASSHIRSQARATAALDTVGDVVLWREAGGEISFANAAAHLQLGLDRRQFSETVLLARVNIGDRPAFLKALSDAHSGDGYGLGMVRISAEINGAQVIRLFELSARRVGPKSGEDAIVIVLRDVTEREAADELREVARLEAERIASSKSQFLATMSHELRTPLNAIIGFSELLVQPDFLPAVDPRRDEYARIINGSGQHLLEVVNAILDMSKIESGMMAIEQEPVELGSVVRSSRELLAVRAAEKSVALIEHLAADVPDIVSDRRAIKQILLNLMSNAVKFTPSGGEVLVTVVRDRNEVEIVVSDTGCGIDAADLGQLGSPFFQVRQSYDRQHEGTGLGLSVVRGLVGLLGGSMMIESAPGAGTRVGIRLAVDGSAQASSTEPVCIQTRIRARRSALDGTGHDTSQTPSVHMPDRHDARFIA